MQTASNLEAIEAQLLIEGIYHYYGYDFRNYALKSLTRRILDVVRAEKLNSISGLQEKVLHDPVAMERLIVSIPVHTTEMFRDPNLYPVFRQQVLDQLRQSETIRIWHAGCSTGEEVYSLAILLHEENLYERCRIYATDINEVVLKKARSGRFPIEFIRDFTRNYQLAGGKQAFSEYYTALDDVVAFHPSLIENVTFARHNFVTDASFNEFDVIFCRNVLIYFNPLLQTRVHNLIYDSLAMQGWLVLGRSEMLRFSPHEDDYLALDSISKVYQKTS